MPEGLIFLPAVALFLILLARCQMEDREKLQVLSRMMVVREDDRT